MAFDFRKLSNEKKAEFADKVYACADNPLRLFELLKVGTHFVVVSSETINKVTEALGRL